LEPSHDVRVYALCALARGDVDRVNRRVFVERALTQHSKESRRARNTAARVRQLRPPRAALEVEYQQALKGELVSRIRH
jgi:hypothetical protein